MIVCLDRLIHGARVTCLVTISSQHVHVPCNHCIITECILIDVCIVMYVMQEPQGEQCVWFLVGWSFCPPFSVFACPLLQSSVYLPLSLGVVLEHSSTLCYQPGHSVDVDSLHISYADIFISQVRTAGGSPPQCQLTVDCVFWNATIIHTTDMVQPSQSALSKQSLHTGKTSTTQYISVGYFFLPGYPLDTAEASHVECVEPSLLPAICIPCVAAIHQCAGNTVIVDRHVLSSQTAWGLSTLEPWDELELKVAFPILLSISASEERLSVMVEPRYVNR